MDYRQDIDMLIYTLEHDAAVAPCEDSGIFIFKDSKLGGDTIDVQFCLYRNLFPSSKMESVYNNLLEVFNRSNIVDRRIQHYDVYDKISFSFDCVTAIEAAHINAVRYVVSAILSLYRSNSELIYLAKLNKNKGGK